MSDPNVAEIFSRPQQEAVVIEDVLAKGNAPDKDNYRFPAVYCLKHIQSEKIYVGSTKDLFARIKDHRGRLKGDRHPNRNIQKAFDENPEFCLIYSQCESKEFALSTEQVLLDQLNKLDQDSLLNIATDARVALNGITMSDETRAKMSESHQKQANTAEARVANSNRMKALWADEEKRKMYLSCVGGKSKPITINGVEYSNADEAAKALNCHRATASRYAREQLKNNS